MNKNKTNCIIIHGCPSSKEKAMDPATRTYDKHWIPWTKQQLIAKGIPTETPLLPEPWEPNYELFKAEFERYPVTEDTILIGHSCGTTFLVRWLGETKQKVAKLILVGPWKITDKDTPERKEFYESPIDKTIPSRVKEIIMFTSDNEREDGKKSVKIIHAALGGKIINLPNHGHYLQKDMGTTEFPELIDAVLHSYHVPII